VREAILVVRLYQHGYTPTAAVARQTAPRLPARKAHGGKGAERPCTSTALAHDGEPAVVRQTAAADDGAATDCRVLRTERLHRRTAAAVLRCLVSHLFENTCWSRSVVTCDDNRAPCACRLTKLQKSSPLLLTRFLGDDHRPADCLRVRERAPSSGHVCQRNSRGVAGTSDAICKRRFPVRSQ